MSAKRSSSKRDLGDTMLADLDAVRGYDPGYDADAGGARLAATLAVASGATATALSGVLPKAASAGGWAAIKASTWGPVAIALALGAGGAAATIAGSHGRESVADRQSVHPAERVKGEADSQASVAVAVVREVTARERLATVTAAPAAPAARPSPEAIVNVEPVVRPPLDRTPDLPPPPAVPLPNRAEPPPNPSEGARSIRDEVREVAALRQLLATDPAKALVAIDGRRGGTGSTLDEERAILALEALAALGRPDEARERARAFLVAHPASAYAARARAVVGD